MSQDHHHPPPLPHQPPPIPVASLSFSQSIAPSSSPAERRYNIRNFFIGLIAGTIVSAVLWILGWNTLDRFSAGGIALLTVPAVKLILGITLICLRGKRSLGAGILTSIALGFLIFFGVCTVSVFKGMQATGAHH